MPQEEPVPFWFVFSSWSVLRRPMPQADLCLLLLLAAGVSLKIVDNARQSRV